MKVREVGSKWDREWFTTWRDFKSQRVGFVNSLAFAKSGNFLIAGVRQEPRLGRWENIPSAHNGVAVHRLKLS